jgi:hypothetical protein
VSSCQPTVGGHKKKQSDDGKVRSLLQNDLGVALPLHVSLSPPLVLKTANKDSFFGRLQQALSENIIRTLTIKPKDLAWHPNESKTRWFLVIRMQKSAELDKLLSVCNCVAKEFKQPLLYAGDGNPKGDEFHISIAWSLQASRSTSSEPSAADSTQEDAAIPYELLQRLTDLNITFREVKIRIGQDVHNIALKPKR